MSDKKWHPAKDEKQPWQCTGKKKYLTWEHASNDARAIRRRLHGKKHMTAEPYRCKKCGFWHTGTREYLNKGGVQASE